MTVSRHPSVATVNLVHQLTHLRHTGTAWKKTSGEHERPTPTVTVSYTQPWCVGREFKQWELVKAAICWGKQQQLVEAATRWAERTPGEPMEGKDGGR